MPIDIAVVPVAGQGTRLLPLTKSQPKEMLPVGSKPVAQYVVEELTRCGVRREDVVQSGIAKPAGPAEGAFDLTDIIEKPPVAEAPSNLAVAARYVFSPAIFDALTRTPPGKGGEIQLTDAIRLLLREGGKV